MPNWTINTIAVEGKRRGNFVFLDHDLFTAGEKGLQFDFNKLIPMPKSLSITEGSQKRYAVIYYLTSKCKTPIRNLSSDAKAMIGRMGIWDPETVFVQLTNGACDYVKSDKLYKDGQQYVKNMEDYGYPTWYDWCCDKWGTKWNACETYVDGSTLSFLTAWSAPIPVFLALSKKFPDTTFFMESDYEGGEGRCHLTAQGGCLLDETWDGAED